MNFGVKSSRTPSPSNSDVFPMSSILAPDFMWIVLLSAWRFRRSARFRCFSRAFASVFILLFLCGCAASPFGGTSNPVLDAYAVRITRDLNADTGPVTAMAERNRVIDAYLFLADLSFREYVNGLYAQVSAANTVADLAILGLSASAALVGGEQAKTILAAGAAAISGSKAIISADWYEQQAKTPLIATMRELRAAKLREIELGKRQPVRAYSLSAGMLDVQEYAQVDVVLAIQKLTERATQDLGVQVEKLEAVKRLPLVAEE